MFDRIKNDIRVIHKRDPAARGLWDVLLCYPGLHAVFGYRLAHGLWQRGWFLLARVISHVARFFTGIEIHPAAQIGQGFFIDHGMGVVIGETTEIGDNVTLYHGVTLGGTSWQKGKRHPTIKDGVIIGAGAKVLGPLTVNANARIGSNAVVVDDVPENSTVVGIPGRVIMGMNPSPLQDSPLFSAYGQIESMPDPVAKAVVCMLEQVHHLEHRVKTMEKNGAANGNPLQEKRP
ncbi:MAG: Serine acetyltransferase [Magnetococcales bacterium]|nr:Serine acetyltransferase [Magnetococcales bacterium]HIJ82898.1 serine O-acetyltransferase [Magnetococcales bacterium]